MNQRPIRVLHVDDDSEFGDLTATFLEHEDGRFAVRTVTSATEALEVVRDRPPDCLVSDYDMPGLNGVELLQRVRDERPELPFILFTGKGSEGVASDAISAGVTDYVKKQSGTEQYELLTNRILNAVGARHAEERLTRQEQLMKLTELVGDTGGWELNLNTNEIALTAGARRVMGLDEDEPVTFEQWIGLYHPADRDDVQAIINDASEATDQVNATWRLDSDGDQRHVAVTMVSADGERDETVVRGAINDVSEHMRRREQLEQTRERMEQALEATNSELFEIDPQTNVETRYGPSERLYGISPEATQTAHPFLTKAVHPADGQRIEQSVAEAVEKAPTPITVEYRSDPDAGEVRWLHGRLSGRPDGTGDVKKIVGVSTDITAHKRRERRLRQYRTVLENINDAVFIADSDRTIVYANEQSLANVDLTADEVAEEPVLTLIERFAVDDAGVDAFEAALDTALADNETGQPESVELTLSVDGTRLVFEYEFSQIPTKTPITEESDPETAVAVVARDITERTARMTELRRTRELFSEMERIADIGAWEYDVDADEVTNTVGTRHIYGIGSDADLTLEEAFEFYHPADRTRLQRLFEDCVECGNAYETDVRIITADGEQKWITARGERVDTHDGRSTVRGYIQDVTAEKERLTRLRQIETLFENAQDMLFIIERAGEEFVIQRVNKAFERATGLSNDQLRGQTPQDVFGTKLGRQIERQYRQCLETSEPLNYEETVEATKLPEAPDDGPDTHWETRIAPVEINGDDEWIVGATRDINERKRRQRELERQNERLEEFASIVSHDLRNPLTVAKGHLELAREERESSHLDDIGTALDRMNALVDDLLTLARSDDAVASLEPVSISRVVENCWATVPTASSRLEVETEQTIRADPGQLKQLVENLFGNAVTHGGRDVTVTVGQSEDGFYIADDGTGVPVEDRDEIFAAGYSTADDGTGFGLRIVEDIATAHGWDIDVTDSDTGGARFDIAGVEIVG